MIVVFLGVVIGDLVFFRGCSSKGIKTDILIYASLLNSGLLVFFRLIFDQEVYFGVRKFYGLVFFRVVF